MIQGPRTHELGHQVADHFGNLCQSRSAYSESSSLPTPPFSDTAVKTAEEKVEAAKVEFYAVPNYKMEIILGDFSTTAGNEYSYIQQVEGTSFTTKQMIMENEW